MAADYHSVGMLSLIKHPYAFLPVGRSRHSAPSAVLQCQSASAHELQALVFYKRAQQLPDYNNTELWGKMADCHQLLGDSEEMVSMYEAVMQDSNCPAWKQSDAALALTRLHLDAGDTLAAQQVLSILKQPGEAGEGAEQQVSAASPHAEALFHRAGLMLRLGQQVCPTLSSH